MSIRWCALLAALLAAGGCSGDRTTSPATAPSGAVRSIALAADDTSDLNPHARRLVSSELCPRSPRWRDCRRERRDQTQGWNGISSTELRDSGAGLRLGSWRQPVNRIRLTYATRSTPVRRGWRGLRRNWSYLPIHLRPLGRSAVSGNAVDIRRPRTLFLSCS